MKLETPHLDYIKTHNLDIPNSSLSAQKKRAITKFNNNLEEFNALDPAEDDEENKKLQLQWHDKLTEQSQNLLSDLEEHFPDGVDVKKKEKEEAEAKKKEEEEAAAKKKEEESEAKKKEQEEAEAKKKEEEEAAAAKKKEEAAAKTKSEEEAEAKKKAEEEAAAKKKKEEENQDPEKTTEEIGEEIIDKIWKERAKDGVLEITEDDLKELGFNCWALLGMWSGEVGKYSFKSPLSETWTITKIEQKKEEEVQS